MYYNKLREYSLNITWWHDWFFGIFQNKQIDQMRKYQGRRSTHLYCINENEAYRTKNLENKSKKKIWTNIGQSCPWFRTKLLCRHTLWIHNLPQPFLRGMMIWCHLFRWSSKWKTSTGTPTKTVWFRFYKRIFLQEKK